MPYFNLSDLRVLRGVRFGGKPGRTSARRGQYSDWLRMALQAQTDQCVEIRDPPGWIAESVRLASVYALAVEAHGSQRRATDGALFLEHVLEVATLLQGAGLDEELVAAGLLHDAVERGTLTREALQRAMSADVAALVLWLTEDASIASFDERKAALREQVSAGGVNALTIFAADKLSDIGGLCRGIELYPDSIESRIGTGVVAMAGHYRESVEMIEQRHPECVFIPALREKQWQLEVQVAIGR